MARVVFSPETTFAYKSERLFHMAVRVFPFCDMLPEKPSYDNVLLLSSAFKDFRSQPISELTSPLYKGQSRYQPPIGYDQRYDNNHYGYETEYNSILDRVLCHAPYLSLLNIKYLCR
jgi:hypothetical protein